MADTLNGRVCRMQPSGRSNWSVQTLVLPQSLQEPAALAIAGRTLWIVERNAHQVHRLDLDSAMLGKFTIGA